MSGGGQRKLITVEGFENQLLSYIFRYSKSNSIQFQVTFSEVWILLSVLFYGPRNDWVIPLIFLKIFFFFDKDHFFKVFIEFVTTLFQFWFFGPEACGILALPPGIELGPSAQEGEGLATAPPGKSLR